MKALSRQNIDTRVASVLLSAKAVAVPTDLFRVARNCRVLSVRAQRMIPRGGLETVEGGFRIFIRDLERERDIEDEETSGLSTRDRFTFAHEIAHTLFYKWADERPTTIPDAPEGPELERLCDDVASRLLIPTEFLQSRMRAAAELTANNVIKWSGDFNVSTELMLRRAGAVGSPASDRAVFLVEDLHGDGRVMAQCTGAELLAVTPRVETYQRLSSMADAMWSRSLSAANGEAWEQRRAGRLVKCQRIALSKRRFFIEATVRD